jgi:hypothetical protein
MNDNQEEHFGSGLKVDNFLDVNAADLSGNAAYAASKTAISTDLAAITAQDVIANTDNKGYTDALEVSRTTLEDSVIHVSTGLTGFYRVPLDLKMLEKVNQGKNFYRQASKAKLNTQSELIHQIADPIKATLGANDITAGDVDGLNTKRLAYLALYSVPQEKIGDGKAARKEMVRLFDLLEQDLDELDDLMAVKETTNPILYSKYLSARAIDNIMGGSGTDGYTITTFTVPSGGSVLVPLEESPLSPLFQLYIRAVSGNFTVCTTNLPASACTAGYNAAQGVTFKATAAELGIDLTGTHLQITNPGSEIGIIRIGPKNDQG